MSDNLETSTEVQEQTLQPVDSVVTGTEESATPQSADDKIVIEVDEQESGQETSAQSGNKDSAMYVRMKKEKEKRKREHEERLKAEAEKEALRRELDELKSKVNPIVNPKPTLESCDYDNERFEREIAAYYQNGGNAQPKPQAETQQQEQFNEQAFEADYYLKESESNVTKSYPKYSEDKDQLLQKFSANGGNKQTFTYLSTIASQANIDIAKANIALNRNNDLFNALINAAGTGNQFAIADVLKQAANKVDLRTSKKVDTLPTPDIQNSGPIDNKSAAVEKAKKAWREAPSGPAQVAAWQEYQRIKKS